MSEICHLSPRIAVSLFFPRDFTLKRHREIKSRLRDIISSFGINSFEASQVQEDDSEPQGVGAGVYVRGVFLSYQPLDTPDPYFPRRDGGNVI